MISEEKLEKVCKDFSKLTSEQQDYIIGIMQALLYAKAVNESGSINEKNLISSKPGISEKNKNAEH